MSFDQALAKTRGGFFSRLFGRGEQPLTAEWLDELEEALVRSDLSVSLVDPLMAQLRDLFSTGEVKTVPKALGAVRETLVAALAGDVRLRGDGQKPRVILVVGVNGSGKTTTAAKLAKRLREAGETPLLAAADTFRAAAIEQLQTWGTRIGVDVIHQTAGSDPAAVVFDAVKAATARQVDALIIDTAGRLHTKSNLMEELVKLKRVAERQLPGAPHESLMVLDAPTGQNGFAQATMFHQAIGLTGLCLTKLDGTAKGGIVVRIVRELGVPIKIIGVGEKVEDLQAFDPARFVDALVPEA